MYCQYRSVHVHDVYGRRLLSSIAIHLKGRPTYLKYCEPIRLTGRAVVIANIIWLRELSLHSLARTRRTHTVSSRRLIALKYAHMAVPRAARSLRLSSASPSRFGLLCRFAAGSSPSGERVPFVQCARAPALKLTATHRIVTKTVPGLPSSQLAMLRAAALAPGVRSRAEDNLGPTRSHQRKILPEPALATTTPHQAQARGLTALFLNQALDSCPGASNCKPCQKVAGHARSALYRTVLVTRFARLVVHRSPQL